MARLELRGVTRNFGKVAAVQNVSLDFADGAFTVLVGPSGCGKTTTLRMIAGLEEIDEGEIRLDGSVINDWTPRARDMAMVFQRYSLYPHLNVRDNVAFGLKARGAAKAEIEQKVGWAAGLLHIEHLLERRPGQLSGGEQQRVAIGRALVRNPRVFLMDEPLSNLDAKLRIEMREELKRLHQELRTTTVFVTHDQAEAMSLGDYLVVMDGGRVIQYGRPLDVYRYPNHIFVAGFIGNPAMNLIKGRVRQDGKLFIFENKSFRLPLPERLARALRGSGYPAGEDFILGIRPENIVIGDAGIAGEVIVPEPLGAETLVLVRLGGHELRLRLDSRTLPEPGSGINCVFPPEHLHLFHGPTGASVTSQPDNTPVEKTTN